MGLMNNSVVREPLSFSVNRVSRKCISFASERSLRSNENFSEGQCVQIPKIPSIYLKYMAG